MKKTMKRIIAVLLAVVMVLPIAGLTVNKTQAAVNYNRTAALNYAAAHWNDGVGQCAQFVSACLTAGGLSVSQNVCLNLWNTLKNYGTPYKLTATSSGNGNIKLSSNSGKVEAGDPLFYVCDTCGGVNSNSAFPHVVICGGTNSSGYLTAYGHNAAWNNKLVWTQFSSGSHAGHNTNIYSIHIDDAPTYTITYNANGGSGAPSQETGTTNFVISSIKPTRMGYTFLGWSESSSATSASCTSGDIVYNIDKNITLYAVWRKNNLNVYYNVNGGSISSDEYKLSSNVIYNKSDSTKYFQKWTYNNARDNGLINKSTFGIYKDGYTFAGWGTTASGGTIFDPDDTTIVPTDLNSNIKNGDYSITLFAQWKPNTLNVYYNANGGSISSDEYKLSSNVIYNKSDSTKYFQKWTYNNAKDNGLINRSTFGIYKDGYTFSGWGTTASGGTIFDPDDTTIVPTDLNSNIKNGDYSITLFAIWEKKTYKVSYDANGGTGAPAAQTKIYGTTLKLSTSKPQKTGYTFAGWNTKVDGTGTSYAAGANYTANSAVTLYAVWKKTPAATKPTAPVVSVNKKLIPKGSSVKLTWTECDNVTNYWIEGFKGETRVMGEINNSMSKTLTLEPGTYSFTVIAINELGETSGNWVEFTVYDSAPKAPVLKVSNDLIKKGEKVTLSWNAVNNVTNYWIQGYKDGKTFVAEIDNSKSRTMILDVGYYEFVVKAINELGETNSNWVNFTVYDPQETTYTLTYNGNGGSGAPSSQSGSSTYTVSYTTPTRSGYTFLGWSTSSSSSYATYDAGDTITLTSNTTLYAVWEQNYNSGSKSKCGRCGATFYDDEALEAHLANCDGYFNNNNISVTIRNNPGTRTLNYGDTVRIYADAQNLPAGAKIGWYVDDGSTISAKVSDDGTYCDITATGNGTVTLAAKAVDANGNVMTDSNGYQIADVQKINTKTSLWLRIVSFFKNLFGINRTTVQLFKGLF